MSIYHCSIKIIGRSSGRSAIASSAYRSGKKLIDRESGLTHDYTNKTGIIYSEILLPENAPTQYADREILWNEVQKIEKNRNAQLAREVEVALPFELSREQQLEVIRQYIKINFVHAGMCADWALHDKGDGNPHAHIMLTTRQINSDGKWNVKEKKVYKLDEHGKKIPLLDKNGKQKVRIRAGRGEEKLWVRETVQANDWNSHDRIEEWRESWANICNQYLSPEQHIDHRSYIRQGIDLEPTIHEGHIARKIEKAGGVSNRCHENREIMKHRALIIRYQKEFEMVSCQLSQYQKEKYALEPSRSAQEAFNSELRVNPFRGNKTPHRASSGISEGFQREEQLKIQLQDLNKQQIAAQEQVEQLLEGKKQWHKDSEKYLCNTEIGRKTRLYYENIGSDIWRKYDRAIFKWRLDSHPEFYKVKYVLEMKEWFKKNKLELPSKEELVHSQKQFFSELEQWDKEIDAAVAQRDSLLRQISSTKHEIDLLNPDSHLFSFLRTPQRESTQKPRKSRDDWER